MTQLRIAAVLVATVSGDYALLALIYGRFFDFGVAATICVGSSLTAGLVANPDRRRRRAAARRRAARAGAATNRRLPRDTGARLRTRTPKSPVRNAD